MIEQCQNCRFYKILAEPAGWCRRCPPPFHPTFENSWCGEYVPNRDLPKDDNASDETTSELLKRIDRFLAQHDKVTQRETTNG